jgi:DNA modification methylase
MLCADPPYNVKVAGHVQGRGRVKHAEFAFASGEMSEGQFRAFLETWLGLAMRFSSTGALAYVFMDWRHITDLITIGRIVFGAMANLCVWAKGNAGQGSFYRSQHELIGVFVVGGEPHRNNVQLGRFGRNRSNLWQYAGVNSFGFGRDEALSMHPTVKPVAMIADAVRDCTSRGEVILDPFLGSGTTLIAAEKTGRRCCGIEYEPRYVDIAIRRWQAFTKTDARLEDDGRTFDEIAGERSSNDKPISAAIPTEHAGGAS